MSIPTEAAPFPQPSATTLVREESSLSVPDLIQKYLSGISIQELAKSNSVAPRTIYRWMLSELGQAEYITLQTQVLIDRIAEADTELDNAETQCQIARAREKMRFSRMDFERRRPQLYGVKGPDQGDKILVIVQREAAKEVGTEPLILQGKSVVVEK